MTAIRVAMAGIASPAGKGSSATVPWNTAGCIAKVPTRHGAVASLRHDYDHS